MPFKDKEQERAYNKEYRRLHPDSYQLKTEAQKEAARAYSREKQREYRENPENRLRYERYKKNYQKKHLQELRDKAREKYRFYRADPVANERIKENSRKHKEKLKQLVVEKYSNGTMACAMCPEQTLPCLSIDHINGGGTAHRKSIMVSAGLHFYHWLKRENFPPGFRVLCMNCQFMSLHEMRRRKRELLASKHS